MDVSYMCMIHIHSRVWFKVILFHCCACQFFPNTTYNIIIRFFPDSSVGKESTCDAGDPSSVSGSGRSAGEGIGYPLQYSWASLVAQLVKNPPEM